MSTRTRKTALLYTFFLGAFGGHKFYYGENGKGVLYLLFFWTWIPGLLALVHFVQLLMMNDQGFALQYGNGEVTVVKEKKASGASPNGKAPENLGDVVQGMKDVWKDPEARKKILRKTFFKWL